ncbi:MAG TPA: DUF4160 domain-containing protein [Longimicrobiaceae bacterium]|nr:DUF4160 domain-containing protein [Longimicrobiaceae bacterium]
MPTVHRERGFAVKVHLDDHPPPHVHVWKSGKRVKILIGDAATPAALLGAGTMEKREARRAIDIVDVNRKFLLAKWRELHGSKTSH